MKGVVTGLLVLMGACSTGGKYVNCADPNFQAALEQNCVTKCLDLNSKLDSMENYCADANGVAGGDVATCMCHSGVQIIYVDVQ